VKKLNNPLTWSLLGLTALVTLHFGTYTQTDVNVFHTDEIAHIYPFRFDQIELHNGETIRSDEYMTLCSWARDWDIVTDYKTETNIFGITRNTEIVENRTQIVQ
jgi:hypothetical protein